jgi:hypothetical protein
MAAGNPGVRGIAVLVWRNKDQNCRMRDWPYDRRLQRIAATTRIGGDMGRGGDDLAPALRDMYSLR